MTFLIDSETQRSRSDRARIKQLVKSDVDSESSDMKKNPKAEYDA